MATKRGPKPGSTAPASNGKAPAPANAWARPLKTTGPPPGMGPADKSRAPSSGNQPAPNQNHTNSKGRGPNGSAISNMHRERLLHLCLTLIGQKVVATLTDGAVLEGIFHTFTPFAGLEDEVKNKYVLNAVKVVKAGKGSEIQAGSTVVLAAEKVAQIFAKNINLDRPNQNGGAKGAKGDFVTDTQISASKSAGSKDLVAAGSAWMTAPPPGTTKPASRAEALASSLGASKTSDTSGLKGSIGKWDQFKANEELFNVNASFDENLYTTELDKTRIDQRKIAEAERIAKEIEGTASANIHIAEERGQAVETDYDEEDRYSGVLTKDGKQRHEASEKPKIAPKMNYAAAAAKADASKNATSKPATPAASETIKADETAKVEPEKPETEKVAKAEEKKAPEIVAHVPDAKEIEKKEEPNEEKQAEEVKPEEKKEAKEAAKASKLNANAKEFTFNPAAKSFTPSFGGGGFGGPQPQQQPQPMDPTMQIHGGHPMHSHYMPPQMGQPGMMPMMNPQYAGMRYPPQYPGMDQQGGPPMQPPQSGNAQPGSTGTTPPTSQGAPTPPAGGEGDSLAALSQDGESSQPSAPQTQGPQSQQHPSHQLQQRQMAMPYNVPQGYFPGGAMPMHPRGPGGFPPQFVGGPQQMGAGPQGAPYGRQIYPMQPGGMPPAMMRGPGGAPYYASPNGPMPYPPGAYGMMDDDGYRGRGGRGQGRGRGRGRGVGRGRGRGHYQQHPQQFGGPGSGRSTPQQGVPDQPGGAAPPQGQPQDGEKQNESVTPSAST